MLEFLKDLYGENALTLEQLESALTEQGKDKFNLVNLAEGNYVSKSKYENELDDKDSQIKNLQDSIKTRDNDLKDLKNQLEKAGTDETALSDLQGRFDTLKDEYAQAKKQFEKALEDTRYESAVKEYAGSFEFTSPAAKRDFISQMINKSLKLEEGKIIGADDFYNTYKSENEMSFVVEKKEESKPTQKAPEIIQRESTPPPERKLSLTEQMKLANEQQK